MTNRVRLRSAATNLVVGCGLYYLSWWVAPPLAFAYGKLTERIIYHGEVASKLILPLVLTVPYAVVAAGVGACVAWLVDSERPIRWAMVPAALYIFFGIMDYHWTRPPELLDRVAQIIDAAFMAIACLGGSMIVVRRRATSQQLVNPG